MRIRRRLPILFGFVLVAAAIALAVVLRKHAPPEPARLLPGADGYLYVSLKWVRRANIAGQMPDVPHEPEYEQFIQATGFQFERDLDQAAFAIHYPTDKPNAKAAAPEPARFSEVFVGRIQGERLRAYLGKISASVETTIPWTSTVSRLKAAPCGLPFSALTPWQRRTTTTPW